MRPLYDEFEEFDDFDFADSGAVNRMLREQEREDRKFASRRHRASPPVIDPVSDEYDDFTDDDYEDYNDDEFDSYSGIQFDE